MNTASDRNQGIRACYVATKALLAAGETAAVDVPLAIIGKAGESI